MTKDFDEFNNYKQTEIFLNYFRIMLRPLQDSVKTALKPLLDHLKAILMRLKFGDFDYLLNKNNHIELHEPLSDFFNLIKLK